MTLQGDNTYARLNKRKIANIVNNSFFNCYCQQGGSLGIINYDYSYIEKLLIYNSSAILGGSLIIIASSFTSFINIMLNVTTSLQTHSMNMKSIDFISLANFIILNAFSLSNGGFQIIDVKILQAIELKVFNISTLNSGAMFNIKSGDTILKKNIFINCIAASSGSIIFLKEKGNLTIFNNSFYDTYAKFGGAIFVDSSNKIIINNTEFKNTASMTQGASIFIDLITNFELESTLFVNCETKSNGIIFLKNIENDAKYIFKKIICQGNKASSGSCIFSEASGNFKIETFEIINCFNNTFYFSSFIGFSLRINQGFVFGSKTETHIIFCNNAILDLLNIVFENLFY